MTRDDPTTCCGYGVPLEQRTSLVAASLNRVGESGLPQPSQRGANAPGAGSALPKDAEVWPVSPSRIFTLARQPKSNVSVGNSG